MWEAPDKSGMNLGPPECFNFAFLFFIFRVTGQFLYCHKHPASFMPILSGEDRCWSTIVILEHSTTQPESSQSSDDEQRAQSPVIITDSSESSGEEGTSIRVVLVKMVTSLGGGGHYGFVQGREGAPPTVVRRWTSSVPGHHHRPVSPPVRKVCLSRLYCVRNGYFPAWGTQCGFL